MFRQTFPLNLDLQGAEMWSEVTQFCARRMQHWHQSVILTEIFLPIYWTICTIPSNHISSFVPDLLLQPQHLLSLPFNETLFALSLAAHHYVTPAWVPLNVTGHLWLRPVLLIAGQLKCEGSQWEDKYKGQRAAGLSQTKAGSSPSLSLLSALLLTSKVKKNRISSLYMNYFKLMFVLPVEYFVLM